MTEYTRHLLRAALDAFWNVCFFTVTEALLLYLVGFSVLKEALLLGVDIIKLGSFLIFACCCINLEKTEKGGKSTL